MLLVKRSFYCNWPHSSINVRNIENTYGMPCKLQKGHTIADNFSKYRRISRVSIKL
jgi:hypothetical protein